MSARVLRQCGISANELRTLNRRSVLTTIRRGWHFGPLPDEAVLSAVRSGGVLGCVSALVFHGAWDPLHKRIHVYRDQHGRRQPPGTLGWCPTGFRHALDVAVAPIDVAIGQVLRCASAEETLVLVESLINRRHLTRIEAEVLLGPVLAGKLDVAESGTETMARVRLRDLKLPVRPQVTISGAGRVDLLVGDRLVIEIDSQAHHRSADAYRNDRIRDQHLVAMGYLVIRVTWEQMMFTWHEVEAIILRVVSNRGHLGPVIPLR